MKTYRPADLAPAELQSLMQTAIAPRPIALASTVDAAGNPNLSPFSFFNMFSTVPPILIFSPARRVRDNTTKHTLENVLAVPEVAIGIVNFSIVQQVSLASTEYENGVNEFVKAGLTMADAEMIRPKLIAECPVNFECKVQEVKPLGNQGGAGNLVICEVVAIDLNENYINDNGKLDQKNLDLVARLGGNWYSRNNAENLFEVPKPLVTKGIGFDKLPDTVKFSTVFTGNDLGMLANTETLEATEYCGLEETHLRAKEFLTKNDISGAWSILKKAQNQ